MDTKLGNAPEAPTSLDQLQLYEILRNVLSFVDSTKALYHCVLVNRDWAEEATSLLWRGTMSEDKAQQRWRTPGLLFLTNLAISNPKRFEQYIGRIQHLSLDDDDKRVPNSSILWRQSLWTRKDTSH